MSTEDDDRKAEWEALKTDVLNAIDAGDPKWFDRFREELMFFSIDIDSDYWPDSYFDFLLSLVCRPSVVATGEGAEGLLFVMYSETEFMTNEQQFRLLPALEAAFARYPGSFATKLIAETLGRQIRTEAAVRILSRLRSDKREEKRLQIAIALDEFVHRSDDAELLRLLEGNLMVLSRDASNSIRAVATNTLKTLRRKLSEV